MHFVIMGAGRVGTALATMLDQQGHSVALIDQDPQAFRRLRSDFSGRRVTGVGFDRDVLRQARIEKAYALAAVSSGDNSNIIAARVARETFGVERVVARIYDPVRAQVYEQLGIPTVASVRRTTNAVLRWLMPNSADAVWSDEAGSASLVRVRPDETWCGQSFAQVQALSGSRIAFVTRLGIVMPASDDMVVQDGDELLFAISGTDSQVLHELLTSAPQEDAE